MSMLNLNFRGGRAEIFNLALSLPPQQRSHYLDSVCEGNSELRESVERLLKAHEQLNQEAPESREFSRQGGAFLERPLVQIPGLAEEPGDQLGPYTLLRLLGEGGFGRVFLAQQKGAIQRKVALKILKPGMDTLPIIARFEAERQALAWMDHPGIARVFDAGATDLGRPYFVMEYVQGESITSYCRSKKLDVGQRLGLFLQVAGAVHHAHQKGIIHRDLKPSNIMVTEEDGKALVKVIDFGIAKAIVNPLTDSTMMTQQGQILGTPEYMSPEQADGSGMDADVRSDVYSLGVILYELLTGARPFDWEGSRGEWLKRLKTVDPPAPSRLGGERTARFRFGRELDWIVLKAISRERERRYESVHALAQDIERYGNDEPVSAMRPSRAYRLKKFVQRHRTGVAAASAAIMALLFGLSLAAFGFVQARHERDAARLARDESEAVVRFLTNMLESADPEERGREVTVLDVLNRSQPHLDKTLNRQPLVAARLSHTIGRTYWTLGRNREAIPHLERAVALRRELLGSGHTSTLVSLGALAGAHYALGEIERAGELFLRALEGLRASEGPDSPKTLGMMNNLAQVYSNSGRTREALELQQEALDLQTRVLGEDHPHRLGSLLNLAHLQYQAGNPEEGLRLSQEAWEQWTLHQGPTAPGTLMAQQNLANAYLGEGRLDEAEDLARRAFEKRRELLGTDHPNTRNSQYNLALILEHQGRLQEAEILYQEIIAADPSHSARVREPALFQLLGLAEQEGWPARSRDLLESSRAELRAIARSPEQSANRLNQTAWILLTAPGWTPLDLELALDAAGTACRKERDQKGSSLWKYLDTLALAQHLNGDPRAAVRSQKEALDLLPGEGDSVRAEMEERLSRYLSQADRS